MRLIYLASARSESASVNPAREGRARRMSMTNRSCLSAFFVYFDYCVYFENVAGSL
jgi:hypothetical protein